VGGYALGVNQRLRRFIVVYAGDCFMWSEEVMAIKCYANCKFKDGLFCRLYHITVDENGRCEEYEEVDD